MGDIFCFEGPHGVGKGTVLEYLVKRIEQEQQQIPVIVRDSEYPEFEVLKERIRRKELSKEETIEITAQTRAVVYTKYIQNIIQSNDQILLDRGYYTSAVWQSETNADVDTIIRVNQSKGIPVPRKTFILDAPLSVILSRLLQRRRFDVTQQSFNAIERDQQRYLYISKRYSECIVINTNRPVSAISDEVITHIMK